MSKSGCYGKDKLDGQELSIPNFSQINFREIHQVLSHS